MAGGPDSIVRAIAAARARARRNFRLDLRLHLADPRRRAGDRDRLDGPGRPRRSSPIWAPLIIAASRSRSPCRCASIVFATLFAVVGALGRLSRTAPIYATATLYVSLVRGTPLIVQVFFIYSALPQFGIVAAAVRRGRLRARVQLRRVHDGDLPGRHPGHPARPGRGGAGARHDRARDDAPDRAAAGDPDRHPGDRQRVHRDDQGLRAGLVRRLHELFCLRPDGRLVQRSRASRR